MTILILLAWKTFLFEEVGGDCLEAWGELTGLKRMGDFLIYYIEELFEFWGEVAFF